jgi:hypothetical protein
MPRRALYVGAAPLTREDARRLHDERTSDEQTSMDL